MQKTKKGKTKGKGEIEIDCCFFRVYFPRFAFPKNIFRLCLLLLLLLQLLVPLLLLLLSLVRRRPLPEQ